MCSLGRGCRSKCSDDMGGVGDHFGHFADESGVKSWSAYGPGEANDKCSAMELEDLMPRSCSDITVRLGDGFGAGQGCFDERRGYNDSPDGGCKGFRNAIGSLLGEGSGWGANERRIARDMAGRAGEGGEIRRPPIRWHYWKLPPR